MKSSDTATGRRHRSVGRGGLAIAIGLALVGAACGGDNSGSSSAATTAVPATTAAGATTTAASSGGATTAAPSGQPLVAKVMFDFSSTGPTAAIAPDFDIATKLAFEDLNKEGLEIQLSTFDPQADPSRAVASYRDHMGDDPIAVMGTLTNTATAIAPLANKDEIPFLNSVAAIVDVATKNRPWVFMAGGDITAITKRGVTAWLGYQPEVTKVVAIADVKNVSTKGQADSAMAAAGSKAGEIVSYETGATDFAALVARAIDQGANGIVVSSLPGDTSAILQEIRRQGSKASVFIVQAAYSPEVLTSGGDAVAGAYVVGQWFNGLTNPETVEYVKRFTALSGGELPVYSLMYESWMLLGHAMLSIPGLADMSVKDARAALRAALEKATFSSLDGSTGLKFNAGGFVDRKGVMTQLTAEGKMVQKDMGA